VKSKRHSRCENRPVRRATPVRRIESATYDGVVFAGCSFWRICILDAWKFTQRALPSGRNGNGRNTPGLNGFPSVQNETVSAFSLRYFRVRRAITASGHRI
jgi:hypothetical protein